MVRVYGSAGHDLESQEKAALEKKQMISRINILGVFGSVACIALLGLAAIGAMKHRNFPLSV